jgi:hypothetical protein
MWQPKRETRASERDTDAEVKKVLSDIARKIRDEVNPAGAF